MGLKTTTLDGRARNQKQTSVSDSLPIVELGYKVRGGGLFNCSAFWNSRGDWTWVNNFSIKVRIATLLIGPESRVPLPVLWSILRGQRVMQDARRMKSSSNWRGALRKPPKPP
jgi:hypothetical protein